MDKPERDSANYLDKFRKNKEIRFMIFVALIAIIGGAIFEGTSFILAYYPYFFMILGILAMMLIKDHKLGILILLFILIAIFPIELFYYGVIPLHENYIPITVPYMQQMFQIMGNFI